MRTMKIGTQISQRMQITQIESVFPFIRVYWSLDNNEPTQQMLCEGKGQ